MQAHWCLMEDNNVFKIRLAIWQRFSSLHAEFQTCWLDILRTLVLHLTFSMGLLGILALHTTTHPLHRLTAHIHAFHALHPHTYACISCITRPAYTMQSNISPMHCIYRSHACLEQATCKYNVMLLATIVKSLNFWEKKLASYK